MFSGKTLLVTGGTGSFGQAFLKRVIHSSIREVRVFSRDEEKQDRLRRSLGDRRIRFFIGDVRDSIAVTDVMRGVDYVFHAAALKQVPSCEFHPMEAVKTNILGTENVLRAAIHHGVLSCVVLSTDKAVYPINSMGISKAMMEKLMIAKSSQHSDSGTVLCATRYGNVMGSRGSIIPFFTEQIRNGLPLTLTEPGMTRFMLSLEDSVDLVLTAFTLGRPGDIFVRKAPACRVDDLAMALCLLLKGKPLPKKIIGARHGEKFHETLVSSEEMLVAEDLGKYYRVPADERDQHYERPRQNGPDSVPAEAYASNSTQQLNVEEIMLMLGELGLVGETAHA
ncbi:NAD-dependent epimerase/dehydratase family protein [Billgrantia pellis]|uniref:NAD-dependent epimerase/dehydratase family protein n=1 Tax=Billgrantia pellis TaxID=2606936 RepID=A0A7V7KGW7_9GAMM|nr:NAD-dependent epimerase/dehydratase family protein [Halomonas pellis]